MFRMKTCTCLFHAGRAPELLLFCIIPVFTLWERFHVCLECSSSLIPRTVPGWGENGFNGTAWKAGRPQRFSESLPEQKNKTIESDEQGTIQDAQGDCGHIRGGSKNGFLLDAGRMPGFYTGRKLRPGRGCHPLFIVEELEKWLIEQAEEQRGEKRRKDRDVMSSFFKKS